jgi:hypothetical protein
LLTANLIDEAGAELKLDMPLRIVFEKSATKEGEFVIYQWSS